MKSFKMIERIICLSFLQFLSVSANSIPLVGKMSNSGAHPVAVPLNNHHNIRYFGNITLGTPPQLFSVIFDSGSSDIIVLRPGYRRICNKPEIKTICQTRQYREFDPEASNTYQKRDGTFAAKFVDDAQRSGFLATDVMGIGSGSSRIEVKVPIGVSDVLQDDAEDADGMFGLAFNMGSSFKPQIMTPFECMVSQADIAPKFSFYCKREQTMGDTIGGELYFGGYNPDLLTSAFLTTVSVNKVTDLYYGWKFNIDGINVGNKEINFNGQDVDGDGVPGTIAIPDTGSASIGAPPAVVNLINFHLYEGRIPMDVHQQSLYLCASLPDKLPPISFVVNGVPLTLGPEDYITSQMDGLVCKSRIHALANAHEIILGYPFLQRFYTMFDYEKREMTFAKAKQPQTNNDDLQPGYSGKMKLKNYTPDFINTLRAQLASGGPISVPVTSTVPAGNSNVMNQMQSAMSGMGGNIAGFGGNYGGQMMPSF